MSYPVIKWVKGNPYLYIQESYRVGERVKTRTLQYLGRATPLDVYRVTQTTETLAGTPLEGVGSFDGLFTSQKPFGASSEPDIQIRYEQAHPPLSTFQGAEDLAVSIIEELHGKQTVSRKFLEDLASMASVKQAERDIILAVLEGFEGQKLPADLVAGRIEHELLPLKAEIITPQYRGMQLDDDWQDSDWEYFELIYKTPFPTDQRHHFGRDHPDYLAHVRYQDDGGERRILELQSDLFQLVRRAEQFELGNFPVPHWGGSENMPDQADIDRLRPYRNTWITRLLREEIRRAARDGISRLYFPGEETAARIEGFVSSEGNLEGYGIGDGIIAYGEAATIISIDYQEAQIVNDYDVVSRFSLGERKETYIEYVAESLQEDPDSYPDLKLPADPDYDQCYEAAEEYVKTHYSMTESFIEALSEMSENEFHVLEDWNHEPDQTVLEVRSGSTYWYNGHPQEYDRYDLSDGQERVVDLYERDIPKQLKKLQRTVTLVTDSYDLPWYVIEIGAKDDRPVRPF